MQVALPMYFPPPVALQVFWAALRELLQADCRMAGVDLPVTLDQPADCHAQWLEPDLLLSQACGYPLVTHLAGQVQLVGTFSYEATGVHDMQCRSQLICRADDARTCLAEFAGSTLAFNDTISQSGYNALRALVAASMQTTKATTQQPFFSATLRTGAHVRSIEAVHRGQADMAAIDAVSWALWQHAHPTLAEDLRAFGQSEIYPGLPLITSLKTSPTVLAALREGLHTVAADPALAEIRAPLLVNGFVSSTLGHYQCCLEMQETAFAKGLHTL